MFRVINHGYIFGKFLIKSKYRLERKVVVKIFSKRNKLKIPGTRTVKKLLKDNEQYHPF